MKYKNFLEKVNRDIANLCPVLQEKLVVSLNECHAAGYTVDIFEGFRAPHRQAILYSQGRDTPGKWVTDAKPWQSFHQYGLAFDVAFKVNGKWSANSWDNSWPWDKVASIFQSHKISWPKPRGERGHFQIDGGLSLEEIRAIATEQSVLGLWIAMDQLY